MAETQYAVSKEEKCPAFLKPQCYLPGHEVGVAGNVLMSGTVHGARYQVSVCLKILNFFNISGTDEATLFKFGK